MKVLMTLFIVFIASMASSLVSIVVYNKYLADEEYSCIELRSPPPAGKNDRSR